MQRLCARARAPQFLLILKYYKIIFYIISASIAVLLRGHTSLQNSKKYLGPHFMYNQTSIQNWIYSLDIRFKGKNNV